MGPECLLERLADLPVAQAAFGAALAALAFPGGTKATATAVAAAARGAAQGAAAGAPVGGAGSTSDGDAVDAISGLDEVLIGLQAMMRVETVPKVEVAKRWLRDLGGGRTASALGRLSTARNVQAHSMAKRVLAEAARLTTRAQGAGLQTESDESDATVRAGGAPGPQRSDPAVAAGTPGEAAAHTAEDLRLEGGTCTGSSLARGAKEAVGSSKVSSTVCGEAARAGAGGNRVNGMEMPSKPQVSEEATFEGNHQKLEGITTPIMNKKQSESHGLDTHKPAAAVAVVEGKIEKVAQVSSLGTSAEPDGVDTPIVQKERQCNAHLGNTQEQEHSRRMELIRIINGSWLAPSSDASRALLLTNDLHELQKIAHVALNPHLYQ